MALTISCTGAFLALRDKLHHARGEAEQFKKRLEGRKVPVLGAFDVLELDQFVDARAGQLRQARGVELLAGNGKHQVSGVDQRRQDDHGPLRLQPQRLRGHVLDAQGVLDQFGAVHHLAVALFLRDAEDVLCILRPVGIEPVAVEKLQGVQHGRRLLRAVLPGNRAQGVLGRLVPIRSRNQHREERVLGRLVLEMGARQTPAMVFTRSRKLIRSWEAMPARSRIDLPLAHSTRDFARPW